jgi:hypothetical protein
MDYDSDYNSVSSVFITDGVGTARMSIANNRLVWENDRWGSWLACKRHGNVELYWWDIITNQGIDERYCAKIQLLTENVPRGALSHVHCPAGCRPEHGKRGSC